MYSSSFVTVFYTLLVLGGHVGMGLILLTILFSKSIKRHPLFVNFVVCLMIYTSSFTLLLYAGHQFDAKKPVLLCTIQSSSVYAATVMTALAGLAMVFNIWLKVRLLVRATTPSEELALYHEMYGPEEMTYQRHATWTTMTLLVVPYLVYFIVAMTFLIEGQHNPSEIDFSQGSPFCRDSRISVSVILIILIAIGIVLLILVGMNLMTYRKNMLWPKPKSYNTIHIRFSLVIRLGIMTLCMTFAFLAAVVASLVRSNTTTFPLIAQASLPLLAFFIFGTQKDLLTVWGIIPLYFWIKRFRRKMPSPSPSPTPPPPPVVQIKAFGDETGYVQSRRSSDFTVSTDSSTGWNSDGTSSLSVIRPPEARLSRHQSSYDL